jgi:arginase family enzyme
MGAHLSPENSVLIGVREASPEEAELMKQSRAHVFTMEDVDGLGIREIMRRSLRIASSGTQGVYVRYRPEVTDIRGFEETSGGLTYRETHQAMEMIAASDQVLAMDVTGISPDHDSKVLQRSIEFILSCFGKKILGR